MQDETPSLVLCRRRLIRDEIVQHLRRRSEKDPNDTRNRFTTRRALLDIIDRTRVENLLETVVGQDHEYYSAHLQDAANRISPDPGKCCCGDDSCTGGRMIFATLLLLGKDDLAFSFFSNPGTCDRELPFLAAPSDPNTDEDGIGALPGLSALVGLDDTEKELFTHLQWQVFTPFLTTLHMHASEGNSEISLPNDVSLPWKLVGEHEPKQEELSYVQKVNIYAGNHDLGQDDVFALKTFKQARTEGLTAERFHQELQANRHVPPHSRIAQPLAAFKHRKRFYLIFPWANGGNLQEVWKKYSPIPIINGAGRGEPELATWHSDKWLLQECLGIAQALVHVHGVTNSNTELDFPPQIHADIKPENILCFESCHEGQSSFFLKLADFGEAKQVSPDSTVKANEVAHIKTYRPPEYSPEDFISLKYDVWSLGCLFLEFITWAIIGWGGIEAFRDEREKEEDDPGVNEVSGQLNEDTFFKRVRRHQNFLPSLRIGTGSKNKVTSRRATKKHLLWIASHVQVSCQVKDSVISHLKDMKGHRLCPPAFKRFLEFIETEMLVVDAHKRADSSRVRDFLEYCNT